ncbi:diguanylate cyclase [Clostridium boliviensis]|uniref:Diguanylate cyclase n=1 Tax=Clostridium boliviensis TaxID=318465 RepID=A0ABU4GQ53_9CLOT|nr:diguanylate cyclase [Clostridium boliviensis]MDW2799758.1 diguanylate cyclase [Clostridium boliviensis]
MNKNSFGYIIQDVGLVILLVCLFAGSMTVSYTDKSMIFEAVVMLSGTFFVILLSGFKLFGLGITMAGIQVTLYTAYRLYLFLSYDTEISVYCYIWILLPLVSAASMYLFVYGNHRLEIENDILKKQVEELVVVNPLTKLYNLRSLYNDLNVQVSYAERNKVPLSLMIVVLKYESELRSILSRHNYEMIIQRLAQLVVDTVRVEDKTYSIDNKGSLAVILTCDKSGSDIAMRRIKSQVSQRDAFAGIADAAIKVEVRIACLEYKKDKFENNMILFKQKVENELQYDV